MAYGKQLVGRMWDGHANANAMVHGSWFMVKVKYVRVGAWWDRDVSQRQPLRQRNIYQV